MDAVFNEVIRMYGPGNAMLMRQIVNNSTKIADVLIPNGVIIGMES
jgi:cytochrome P450